MRWMRRRMRGWGNRGWGVEVWGEGERVCIYLDEQ